MHGKRRPGPLYTEDLRAVVPISRIPAATSSFNTEEARAAFAVRRPVNAHPGVARGAVRAGGDDDIGDDGNGSDIDGGNGIGSRTAVASVSRVST
nr:hypothetical protein GCM10010200_052670 [Actinomadura rugatobispora]